MAQRREMAAGKRPLDWVATEALTLAATASDGTHVRLGGQDTVRGTFSQRNTVAHDGEELLKQIKSLLKEPARLLLDS